MFISIKLNEWLPDRVWSEEPGWHKCHNLWPNRLGFYQNWYAYKQEDGKKVFNKQAITIDQQTKLIHEADKSLSLEVGGKKTPLHKEWRVACVSYNHHFLLLGNILKSPLGDQYNTCIAWSHLDDIYRLDDMHEEASMADYQNLHKGTVLYISLHKSPIIICEEAILRMHYVGPPYIWQFETVLPIMHKITPQSIFQCGDDIFFYDETGFQQLSAHTITPIGFGKIDQWFLEHYQQQALNTGHLSKLDVVFWSWPYLEGYIYLLYNYKSQKWGQLYLDVEDIGYTKEHGLFGIRNNKLVRFIEDKPINGQVTTSHILPEPYQHVFVEELRIMAKGAEIDRVAVNIGRKMSFFSATENKRFFIRQAMEQFTLNFTVTGNAALPCKLSLKYHIQENR